MSENTSTESMGKFKLEITHPETEVTQTYGNSGTKTTWAAMEILAYMIVAKAPWTEYPYRYEITHFGSGEYAKGHITNNQAKDNLIVLRTFVRDYWSDFGNWQPPDDSDE